MKPSIILAALLVAPLLASCAGFTKLPAPITEAAMKQYGERCKSHVWGATGIMAGGGFDLDCKPIEPAAGPTYTQQMLDAIDARVKQALEDFAARQSSGTPQPSF